MRSIIFTILLLGCLVYHSAGFEILYPSGKYYLVQNTTTMILWNSNSSDPTSFSIFVENKNDPNFRIFAIANSVNTSLKNTTVSIPSLSLATSYDIVFTNVFNISDRFATSGNFEIKSAGTPTSQYAPPDTKNSSTGNNDGGNSTGNGNSKSSATSNYYYYSPLTFLGLASLVWLVL